MAVKRFNLSHKIFNQTRCKSILFNFFGSGANMNGHPTIYELDNLSKGITGCWQSVGRKLGVDEDVIEDILENNVQHIKPHEKSFQMLKTWHDQGRSSTYETLATALRGLGKGRLAERFE